MKKQVFVIHGGSTFNTYAEYLADLKSEKIDINYKRGGKKRWKETLDKKLGKNFQVIYPEMPNADNARYPEWKIWFEKFIPHTRPGLIFVGHSLGGIFLAKYLSENNFPKKIAATFLVAAPFYSKYFHDGRPKESVGDFALPKSFKLFEKQGGMVHLYHSKDDFVVPFSNLLQYEKVLPSAQVKVFKDKNHFLIEKFPEIVKEIKAVSLKK